MSCASYAISPFLVPFVQSAELDSALTPTFSSMHASLPGSEPLILCPLTLCCVTCMILAWPKTPHVNCLSFYAVRGASSSLSFDPCLTYLKLRITFALAIFLHLFPILCAKRGATSQALHASSPYLHASKFPHLFFFFSQFQRHSRASLKAWILASSEEIKKGS